MPFIEQQLTADGVLSEGRVIANKAILEIIINDHIESMAVNSGGSGYAVGDTFRLNSGIPVNVNGDDFHAVGRVTSIGSPGSPDGAVTGVEVVSAGAYTTLPEVSPLNSPEEFVNNLSTVTLTGAGSGLVVDVTTTPALWTQDSSTYVASPEADGLITLFDWLATSTKAANAPTIGGSSQLSATNDGIRFTVATSYSGILPWNSQPGSPPTNTFYISVPNQNPKVYVSTTERRVNVLVTDGTNRQYAGMGLFIPFVDVDSNYPFPGIIYAQSTSVRAVTETYSNTLNAGIVHPINFSGLGCYQYRNNLSTEWFGITSDNANGTQTSRGKIWPDAADNTDWEFNYAPVPTGSGASASDMNPFTAAGEDVGSFQDNETTGWFNVTESGNGRQGPAPYGLGGQLHFTVQAHLIQNLVNDAQLIGRQFTVEVLRTSTRYRIKTEGATSYSTTHCPATSTAGQRWR
jgi:hypothetical protein